jgi:formyltetrahydrofolate hydrolase
VSYADAKGVVASLAQLLFGFNCNIVQSDQFSDESLRPSRFFQVGTLWVYVAAATIHWARTVV